VSAKKKRRMCNPTQELTLLSEKIIEANRKNLQREKGGGGGK